MLKKIAIFLLFFTCVGCFYPQEKRQQLNQLPEHIQRIQSAVELYTKNNGVLPYKYQSDERKFTSKYTVDLNQLTGSLDEIPPTAFEKGGTFLFVLINVEQKPMVRAFDMRISDPISRVEQQIRDYKERKGKLPLGKPASTGYFSIDYQQLGMDPVQLPSPYHPSDRLLLVMDSSGFVYIDYRESAMKMIQQAAKKPSEGDDLRLWMAEQSLYVPAYSPPMVWKKQEPVWQ